MDRQYVAETLYELLENAENHLVKALNPDTPDDTRRTAADVSRKMYNLGSELLEGAGWTGHEDRADFPELEKHILTLYMGCPAAESLYLAIVHGDVDSPLVEHHGLDEEDVQRIERKMKAIIDDKDGKAPLLSGLTSTLCRGRKYDKVLEMSAYVYTSDEEPEEAG